MSNPFRGYVVAGMAATTVHYATMLAVANLGVAPVSAASAGYTLGGLTHYLLCAQWIFRMSAMPLRLAAYLIVWLFFLGLNAAFIWLLTSFGVGLLAAQIVSTAVLFITKFQADRGVVFAAKGPPR